MCDPATPLLGHPDSARPVPARQRAPARDRLDQRKLARAAAALMSFALLLLPARSADRKKSLLPFGRRGGVESGLLNAPRLLSLLLDFTSRLSCRLCRFRGRSLCGFARYRLASDSLSFRDPDVAGGDDLRSSLYPPQRSCGHRHVCCPAQKTQNWGLSTITRPSLEQEELTGPGASAMSY